MTRTRSRSSFAIVLLLTPAMLPLQARAEDADTDILSEARILHDAAIPAAGNADGDITIVEYFDYQCPYCRKISPDLAKVVREDGHVRLVFKDWPIFGGVSIYAARLTLASRYQDKFAEAHEALISLKEKLSEAKVDAALSAAGIDLARAKADLAAKRTEIDAVLARNHEQATGLGFQGTPAFIIGHFRVPGAPNAQAFKQAIADARAAATN
ncbi:MAG: DsbA family protein [Bradyrhizobium sp.]|jgi:protein-disulfide isomerase|uniref:DsbA family protein n=2 Tax=Pseudomonadota TaxID=1224 RepID=A0ABS5GEH7_9BRAD|nr:MULTISPECIES: DsbA family protein [Bradyrhizobium]MBR1139643.1 DsbA family protein [Bradyrhizobium denitrificans]MDU0953639.1 DsbA family protein [Bradyrhizobium sp.]MDU1495353.1 DsbA family protein [Bradyrhizobium sp.]MDU1545460.1 DsbA family protein [Bradyrhizobium sp.]MDU1690997.1 DsbA family protein [Bradyrhizobium sp.]